MITSAERNALEATIDAAVRKVAAAYATAKTYGFDDVAERLEWAGDFLDAASEKLSKEET